MTASTDDKRRVVPRWRPFRVTLSLEELSTSRKRKIGKDLLSDLAAKNRDWLDRGNVESAIDLVHTAALLNRLEEVQDAVSFILATEGLPDLVKQSTSLDEGGGPGDSLDSGVEVAQAIARLKAAVRNWPRDAMLWTDLALLYCTLGLDAKAKRCLLVAGNLAPESRYVLRCTTRFLIHNGDPEGAMHLLRSSMRAARDPWLLAAGIAASQIAERSSTFIGPGLRVLESQRFSEREISELAASLGTIEVEDGRIKKAKRLFDTSARAPNDNVKAQLEWLKGIHRRARPDRGVKLDGDLDHEARAVAHWKAEDWGRTIDCCKKWGMDEPFSDRPYSLGSYIAIEALGDAKQAEELVRKGLLANSRDVSLLNNLAVSLAYQGRLNEADKSWKAAGRATRGGEEEATIRATGGLLHYRRGDVEAGRKEYVSAIRLARANGSEEEARRATVYLVLEEVMAETAESTMLSDLLLAKKESVFAPETRRIIDRIRRRRRSASATGQVGVERMNALGNLIDWG